MKPKRSKSLAALARTEGLSYQRVLRAKERGVIPNKGPWYNENCRRAIEALAAQRAAGNSPDPVLLKWSRRKKRAEALRLEKELKADEAPESLPVGLVRKAW